MSKEQQIQTEALPQNEITPQTLLDAKPRWHLAIRLRVAEGFDERFQPTGFPNLGPALYKAMDGENPADYLLVESAQSLANWMEALCQDPANPCRYNDGCAGIPYVVVQENVNGKPQDLTSSLTEPHRLASDELLEKASFKEQAFKDVLMSLLNVNQQRPVYLPRIAKRLFYVDPACLLHGVFLEKLDGRIRFPRLLSASITAKHPQPVNTSGIMRGHVKISGTGNSIPYSTQHFTSPEILLHLTFHTDSLNGLGLDDIEKKFWAAFALHKINLLLNSFPRLRTACVLDTDAQQIQGDLDIENTFTANRRKAAFDIKDGQEPASENAINESVQKIAETEKKAKDAKNDSEKKALKAEGDQLRKELISQLRSYIVLRENLSEPLVLQHEVNLKSKSTDRQE